MRSTRYSTSRQKACRQCASAKAKCDRKAGACSRCEQRALSCAYPQGRATPQPEPDVAALRDGIETERGRTPSTAGLSPSQSIPSVDRGVSGSTLVPLGSGGLESPAASLPLMFNGSSTISDPHKPDNLDFTDLRLTCPINAEDIANRWLNSFVPIPGQTTKKYTPSISTFIQRILNSYASSSVRGHAIPPFIHWSQLALPSSFPLRTCLRAIRICDKPPPGDEGAAVDVLQKEMAKLHEQQATYDDMALLAAFQAHLVYAMVIFFRLGREYHPSLRQAMVNTQELACATARGGLVCTAERDGARPRWEAWIAAEAKRRTLFTMCLFDSALLTHDGLPTHLATELRGLPAPGGKSLWAARDRGGWAAGYDVHLAEWPGGVLHIDELWPMPENFGERDVAERRGRVDLWLEDLDEFGTMIYAVTSGTHGG